MNRAIFDLVSFIGAIQGVIIAVFLFSRRKRTAATLFLATYCLIFSIGLLEPFAVRTLNGPLRIPVLSFLGASNFLYGPLVFLLVTSLGTISRLNTRRMVLHATPFLLVFMIETGLNYFDVSTPTHDLFLFIAFESLVVQLLFYNAAAIRLLNVQLQEGRSAKWLRSVLIFITAIYVVSFSISHLIFFGAAWAQQYYLIVQCMITLLIYYMTYRIILQPDLFVAYARMGEMNGNGTGRYARSGLKEHQAEQYLKELEAYMVNVKPYRDPDISIHTLAQQIGISKNHLTQILNENLRKNFYEFINTYRVEEVKGMMADPAYSHLTLTGLGLEAGFKSKTAFNLNFKKHTGATPTEWKKRCESDATRE